MKKTILTLAISFVGFAGFSQDYFHKFGVGFSYVTYDYEFTDDFGNYGGSIGDGGGHLVYQAGLNFELGDILNLAPTAYPAIGASFISTSVGGAQVGGNGGTGGGVTMFLELPVLAELFIGDREEGFGGFFGAGFNYSYFTSCGSVIGPQLSGGIHFNLEGNTLFGRSLAQLMGQGGITMRGAYTIPVNEPAKLDGAVYTLNEYNNHFTFSILWDLGR